jgi:hypothetical protein
MPTLRSLLLQGPVEGGIEQFVAERQLSGNPITISGWEPIFSSWISLDGWVQVPRLGDQ